MTPFVQGYTAPSLGGGYFFGKNFPFFLHKPLDWCCGRSQKIWPKKRTILGAPKLPKIVRFCHKMKFFQGTNLFYDCAQWIWVYSWVMWSFVPRKSFLAALQTFKWARFDPKNWEKWLLGPIYGNHILGMHDWVAYDVHTKFHSHRCPIGWARGLQSCHFYDKTNQNQV